MIDKKPRAFLLISFALFVLTIVLIEIYLKYSKFEFLVNIILILIPHSIIMLSAALTNLAKIKAKDEVREIVVFFTVASLFIFSGLLGRLVSHKGGESALAGVVIYWLMGAPYTAVVTFIICKKYGTNKKK